MSVSVCALKLKKEKWLKCTDGCASSTFSGSFNFCPQGQIGGEGVATQPVTDGVWEGQISFCFVFICWIKMLTSFNIFVWWFLNRSCRGSGWSSPTRRPRGRWESRISARFVLCCLWTFNPLLPGFIYNYIKNKINRSFCCQAEVKLWLHSKWKTLNCHAWYWSWPKEGNILHRPVTMNSQHFGKSSFWKKMWHKAS